VSVTLFCGLAIFTLKSILRPQKEEEEELWKLKYFTLQKYNLQKNPLKTNQTPSTYILLLL
jgi:hypothetical protein